MISWLLPHSPCSLLLAVMGAVRACVRACVCMCVCVCVCVCVLRLLACLLAVTRHAVLMHSQIGSMQGFLGGLSVGMMQFVMCVHPKRLGWSQRTSMPAVIVDGTIHVLAVTPTQPERHATHRFACRFNSYALALWYGAQRVAAGAYSGGQVLAVLVASLLGSFSLGLVSL